MGILIGLDVGFGDVKVVFRKDNKLQGFKFPSAVVPVGASTCDFGGLVQDDSIDYGGKSYLVGDRATDKTYSSLDIMFLEKFSPLFAYAAIKKVREETGEQVDGVVVGLPLAYFNDEKRIAIKKAVSTFIANGEVFSLDAFVLPQGYGTLLDFMLENHGEVIGDNMVNILVLDVGFNTIDVVFAEKGKAIKESSGMLERKGVSQVLFGLRNEIQNRHNLELMPHDLKDVLLSGKLKIFGKEHCFATTISDLLESYSKEVFSAIDNMWHSPLKKADRLVLAGGGAYLLKDHLPEKYKDIAHVIAEPEFSNARGFLKSVGQAHSGE